MGVFYHWEERCLPVAVEAEGPGLVAQALQAGVGEQAAEEGVGGLEVEASGLALVGGGQPPVCVDC